MVFWQPKNDSEVDFLAKWAFITFVIGLPVVLLTWYFGGIDTATIAATILGLLIGGPFSVLWIARKMGVSQRKKK